MRNRITIIFFLIVFMASNIFAQINNGEKLNLSLAEVTKIALENNFDIQLAKYDISISRTSEQSAESIYDTILSADASYKDNQLKQTSAVYGTKTLENEYSVGLSKKAPTGTTISMDMDNTRTWNNGSTATNYLNHESKLSLGLKQELGKNFFGLKDRGNIKINLLDVENSKYINLDKIETLIANVQKAYWDLAKEYEKVSIQEDMVEQAKKLYDLHQEKLKDGLVEKPEAIASEANYEKRKNELKLVKNELSSRINSLKLLLNIEDDGLLITAVDTMKINGIIVEQNDSLKKAIENRRDYKRAHNDVKAKNISLEINKNNIWPEINLNATLAKNGLGDHFKDSATGITAEDNTSVSAGVAVSIPLENNDAKAKLKAAELQKAKAILNLKQVERTIAVDLIDQVRNCNIFKEVAISAENVAKLQEEKLKEEEKRFNVGRSNTDTLIRFQEDLISARGYAVESKHRYFQSLVDLELLEGVLLNKYWDGKL